MTLELAKHQLDIGLLTNRREEMLSFWQAQPGVAYEGPLSVGGGVHPMEAHKLDSRGIYYMGKSADVNEGIQSFLEKRPADFKMSPAKDMPGYFPWWDKPKYS